MQSDRLGTSVADVLRVQADNLRVKRRQMAMEIAAKMPVKLIFPLVLFIFPQLILVILGPAMIQIFRTLSEMAN
jgi:tight adherence protein C